jgi:hypothetical protein
VTNIVEYNRLTLLLSDSCSTKVIFVYAMNAQIRFRKGTVYTSSARSLNTNRGNVTQCSDKGPPIRFNTFQ